MIKQITYYKKNRLTCLGVICFYWFMLTGFWGRDGHYISLIILSLLFIFRLKDNWYIIKSSSLFWIIICLSLYVAVNTLTGYYQDPGTLTWQIQYSRAIFGLAGLFSLAICPWLLSTQRFDRYAKSFITILLSLGIQVTLELFIHQDGVSLNQLIYGRPDFQMGANSFGFLCAILLVGVICLGFYKVKNILQYKSKLVIYLNVLMQCICFSLLLLGLIISQSRASWLATGIALCFISTAFLWNYRSQTRFKKFITYYLISVLIISGITIFLKHNTIIKRINDEVNSIKKIAKLEFSDISENSIGKRIHIWKAGILSFYERPLFGWSPGKTKQLIKQKTGYSYSHFHNIPLQILLSVGSIGFILILYVYIISIKETYLSIRDKKIPLEWGIFWFGSIIIILIVGSTGFLIQNIECQFIISFLLSLPITCQLDKISRRKDMPDYEDA